MFFFFIFFIFFIFYFIFIISVICFRLRFQESIENVNIPVVRV